ncbi:hypothetical protein H0H93_015388, partial [Arthromyces matolae]
MMARIHSKAAYERTPAGRRKAILSIWDTYIQSIGLSLQSMDVDMTEISPFSEMVDVPFNLPIDEALVCAALAAFADAHQPSTLEELMRRGAPWLKAQPGAPPHTYSINSVAAVYSCAEQCPE